MKRLTDESGSVIGAPPHPNPPPQGGREQSAISLPPCGGGLGWGGRLEVAAPAGRTPAAPARGVPAKHRRKRHAALVVGAGQEGAIDGVEKGDDAVGGAQINADGPADVGAGPGRQE